MKYDTNKTSATIGLYIDSTRDHGYISFIAYPVWIGLRPSELARIDAGHAEERDTAVPVDRITNIGGWQDGDNLINGLYLDHFKVTSQGNDDTRSTEHTLYGFDYSYRDVFSVSESDAEKMALTLKKVRIRLDKAYETFGAASTFGAYVLRIAHAIGASRIVVSRTPGESSDGRREHRIMELASGGQYVDGLVRTWADSFTVKASA